MNVTIYICVHIATKQFQIIELLERVYYLVYVCKIRVPYESARMQTWKTWGNLRRAASQQRPELVNLDNLVYGIGIPCYKVFKFKSSVCHCEFQRNEPNSNIVGV